MRKVFEINTVGCNKYLVGGNTFFDIKILEPLRNGDERMCLSCNFLCGGVPCAGMRFPYAPTRHPREHKLIAAVDDIEFLIPKVSSDGAREEYRFDPKPEGSEPDGIDDRKPGYCERGLYTVVVMRGFQNGSPPVGHDQFHVCAGAHERLARLHYLRTVRLLCRHTDVGDIIDLHTLGTESKYSGVNIWRKNAGAYRYSSNTRRACSCIARISSSEWEFQNCHTRSGSSSSFCHGILKINSS